jgi:TonB family protein
MQQVQSTMRFAGLSVALEAYYACLRGGFFMLELKTTSMQKSDESVLAVPTKRAPREQNQRRMMLVALALLLVALVVVIYRDRDFWFPDSDDADDLQPVPATVTIQTQPSPATVNSAATEKSAAVKAEKRHHAKTPAGSVEESIPTAPATTSTARTVLPPLEVEVVAGDYHRQVHASPNSLQVDLQQGAPPRKVSDTVSPDQNAAATTMNAAENLRISAEAAEVVSQPVRPGYPVLARQMKVQGSVILQALIGRDGLIQDLHVLTGPPILADAAEQAVRQWRFKPHYQNNQPVETQTSITVNFTISTN